MRFLPFFLLYFLFSAQTIFAGGRFVRPICQIKDFRFKTKYAPASLIYFTTVYIDNKVRLSWNTENEVNVKKFEVERSDDGISYVPVNTVSAKNTSGENNYIFFDKSDLSGTLHYRLKIINGNGDFSYSNVNTVNIRKADNLKIIPNIVTDNIFVFHSRARAGARIEVYSFDGRRMVQLPVLKDAVQTNINAANMPPGRYHLVFADNEKVEFVKFIRQ